MKLVDVRGRRNPLLIADLTRELRTAADGYTVEVLTDSHAIVDTLVRWCREARHTLLSIDSIDGDGDLRVFFHKGAPPPRASRRPNEPTREMRMITL